MFARNPNRSAVRAEVLPFSICATTHRKGGGGWLAGCGRHPIQRRSFCDVMRAQCQRHGHGGHGGSLQDRMSLVSAVVSRGQTLDKRPGSGELLAFRPARVGRASFLLACEHGFFHHNDTRVRNNNTASLLCSFSIAVPLPPSDQTHMDHVCWACDCFPGTAVPAHLYAVAEVAAQTVHTSLHVTICAIIPDNN
jgi:hypothetical protein